MLEDVRTLFSKTRSLDPMKLSSLKQLADDILASRNAPDLKQSTWMAERLVSVYRGRDFVNPAAFITALAMTFEQFPVEVGLIVSDPVNGTPSKRSFAPSLAEVKADLMERKLWAKGVRLAIGRLEKELREGERT